MLHARNTRAATQAMACAGFPSFLSHTGERRDLPCRRRSPRLGARIGFPFVEILICFSLLLKRMKSRQKFGRPFFSAPPASPCVRPLCAQVPPYSPAVQSEPQPPNPPPTRHLLQSAPPLPATPLHAPPHSPLYPRRRRSAFLLYSPATLPPALLLSSPLYLCRCWSVFSREIPAPRRQSHNSRRPATAGSLLPAHVISLPLSLPHPRPPGHRIRADSILLAPFLSPCACRWAMRL
jgi:hypothetical protein